jgi:hypothetical protein
MLRFVADKWHWDMFLQALISLASPSLTDTRSHSLTPFITIGKKSKLVENLMSLSSEVIFHPHVSYRKL